MELGISKLQELKEIDSLDFVVGLDINGGIGGKPKTKKIKIAKLQSFLISAASGIIRDSTSITTSFITNKSSEKTVIHLAKAFAILQISTNTPAWIRLYSTTAYQVADRSRNIDADATGNHGLILEAITNTKTLALTIAPIATGASLESIPNADIPITITNLSGISNSVTVNFSYFIIQP